MIHTADADGLRGPLTNLECFVPLAKQRDVRLGPEADILLSANSKPDQQEENGDHRHAS